jgi:hypothetical protein
MRRTALIVATLACTVMPAAAQGQGPTPAQAIEEARRQQILEADRQYEAARRARGETPAATGSFDPWGGMRGSEAPAKKPDKKSEKKTTAKKPMPLR